MTLAFISQAGGTAPGDPPAAWLVIHTKNPWPGSFMIRIFGVSMFLAAATLHLAIIYLVSRPDLKRRLSG